MAFLALDGSGGVANCPAMLHAIERNDAPPTVFLLHFLGGSAREWEGVAERLAPVARCRPIDLPGFGDAAAASGHAVEAMADHVAAAIRAAAPTQWLIAGHSMGAKVAARLARRAEDGEAGLEGLRGLFHLAGSPPAPEPMEESRREDMLGWFRGDARESRSQAERYVDANASALDAEARELAVRDVLRMNPEAWRAWLGAGSREDLSETVGTLRTPALILAGADDADLGAEAQRRLTAPHFTTARIEVIEDARHLLPLEATERVAALMADFIRALPPLVPKSYKALLEGDRTSAKLRAGLLERAAPDDPAYVPAVLDAPGLAALRALLDRALPQPGTGRIDLAARLDRMLAGGEGDGWRPAGLPPDAEALRAALRTLDAATGGYAALDPAAQDGAMARLAKGELGADAPGLLDAARMKAWFADTIGTATRLFVAHPATLARMGYSGVAAGGDGLPKPGFQAMGMGQRESWEPLPA